MDRPSDYDLQYRMYESGVRFGFIDKVVAHVPAIEGKSGGWIPVPMILRIIKDIIKSFFYIGFILIKSRSYKFVFYSPQNFNRGANGQNIFFDPLIKYCNQNQIDYVFFEEPDRTVKYPRHKKIQFLSIFFSIL